MTKTPSTALVAFVPCTGEAHASHVGGMIDNCALCTPFWGRRLVALDAAQAGATLDIRDRAWLLTREVRDFGTPFEMPIAARCAKKYAVVLGKPFSDVG